MTDAMAGRTKAVLRTHNFPMIRHKLNLQTFSKIIPIGHWHIRKLTNKIFLSWETSFPINNEYN
jgi:hypothetical protein